MTDRVGRALRQCRADGGRVDDKPDTMERVRRHLRGAYEKQNPNDWSGAQAGGARDYLYPEWDRQPSAFEKMMASPQGQQLMTVLDFLGPAKGILIGPSAAARLGRKPGSWGSPEALAEARALRAAGASPAEVWQKHGWSDNAYGNQMGWHTAIDDRPMTPTKDWHKSGATVGEQVDHPELFQAYPEMTKPRLNLKVGSPVDYPNGGTTLRESQHDREFRNRFGSSPEWIGFSVEGITRPDALATATHEFQHGVSFYDKDKVIPQGSSQSREYPRFDTPRSAAAKTAYEAGGMQEWEKNRAGAFASYYNNPGEMIARGEAAIRARDMPLETPRQHEYVDIYDLSDHMGPVYEFSGYRPFGTPEP